MVTSKIQKSTTSPKKKYSAPALEKGLDIIELLAQKPESLSQSEIAVKLGRSVGEVFRMIMVLEDRGYVKPDEGSDKYHLTLKLFGVVHQHTPVRRLTTITAPFLQQLSQTIQQSSHLSVSRGKEILVIAQQDSNTDRSFGTRVGARAPMFQSCSGSVIYAFSKNQQRENIISAVKLSGAKTPTKKDLGEMGDGVRNAGYVKAKSRQISGVVDIGFPVFGHSDEVVASLVVPFLKQLDNGHHMKLKDSLTHIEETAKAISLALGASGYGPVLLTV